MHLKELLFSTLLITCFVYAETSVGLDVNNEDVELAAEINFNSLADYSSGTTYVISGTYLYSGGNDNDNGEHLFTLGFSGQNNLPGVEGLSVTLGAKGVFADNFAALPLFVRANYALPLIDTIPTTSFFAGLAYAPSVLTFSDGEDYSEFRIGADMEVISNTHIFVGYRNIDTDYTYGDYNFNDSFYGGLKLSF
ncbi:hypothetical protein YH65_02410 [Sulfurovum lithotrophicum]|uniref:Outer membrane protein beta-barrel domain-containing protein n=1 Tax=Sulfurovum lithotrophicum TaxID=206403 RepID=A0A7U4M029_9BACT|nr:YfaZ family outer membrane protein [Sulfurovum lithotrophicum]AKF24374.1 hypothetical protein YH65_02410 [Sulfurovum lithotrophicum]